MCATHSGAAAESGTHDISENAEACNAVFGCTLLACALRFTQSPDKSLMPQTSWTHPSETEVLGGFGRAVHNAVDSAIDEENRSSAQAMLLIAEEAGRGRCSLASPLESSNLVEGTCWELPASASCVPPFPVSREPLQEHAMHSVCLQADLRFCAVRSVGSVRRKDCQGNCSDDRENMRDQPDHMGRGASDLDRFKKRGSGDRPANQQSKLRAWIAPVAVHSLDRSCDASASPGAASSPAPMLSWRQRISSHMSGPPTLLRGAAVGSVTGGAVGVVGGGAAGVAIGIPLAPFTLGLSLIAAPAIGVGAGLVGGASTGGVVGGACGGIARWRSERHQRLAISDSITYHCPDDADRFLGFKRLSQELDEMIDAGYISDVSITSSSSETDLDAGAL